MSVGLYIGQPPIEDGQFKSWLDWAVSNINTSFSAVDTDTKVELDVASSVSQFVAAVDAPEKIYFDALQTGAYKGISSTAAGDFTANVNGTYRFDLFASAGRVTSSAVSYLTIYMAIGGVASAGSVTVSILDTASFTPVYFGKPLYLRRGQVVSFWQVVDSTGNINAGLRPFTPTNGAVPATPSARVIVSRIIPVDLA